MERTKCKKCVWHRLIMLGDVWCELHRGECDKIKECRTYSPFRRYAE